MIESSIKDYVSCLENIGWYVEGIQEICTDRKEVGMGYIQERHITKLSGHHKTKWDSTLICLGHVGNMLLW